MKPLTLLLVAGAFVAGVSLGSTAPLVKAGSGLAEMFADAAPMQAKAIRITAIGETLHDSFQPADFRWSAHGAAARALICAPNDQFAHDALPEIQHL